MSPIIWLSSVPRKSCAPVFYPIPEAMKNVNPKLIQNKFDQGRQKEIA